MIVHPTSQLSNYPPKPNRPQIIGVKSFHHHHLSVLKDFSQSPQSTFDYSKVLKMGRQQVDKRKH
jgi:hypothetical protein